ncbi:hypothetical protein [Mucisphaera sp.]|uniref:hypothetical protein n=1 Tax=Mucisphaera sp. TaxID=2913024 RepID=UPI003D14F98D
MKRSLTTILIIGLMIGLFGVPRLHAETWSEPMFGLSIDTPPGLRIVEQTTDGALLKIVGEDSAVASLHIEQQSLDWSLPDIRERALAQLGFGASQPLLLDESPHRTEIAGHRAHWWKMRVTSETRGEFYLAQAFIMLSPRRYAVIQSEADWADAEAAAALFDTTIAGLSVKDQNELGEEHLRRLRAGDDWLKAILPAMTRAGQRTQNHWFLIEADGEVIGYERHTQTINEDFGTQGLSVERMRRVFSNQGTQDALIRAFASADGTIEVWEARTTFRQPGTLQTQTQSSAVTAVRSGDSLIITREEPTSTSQTEHAIPELGYLPMAHQLALGPGWLDALGRPIAFYHYYAPTASMSFALAEAAATSDGWTVTLYPAPRRAAQALIYDHDGQLLEHRTPDGRILRRVTPEQLRQKVQHLEPNGINRDR